MRVINTVPGMITFRHNALPIEWNIAVKVIDRQPELSYYFSYKEIRWTRKKSSSNNQLK